MKQKITISYVTPEGKTGTKNITTTLSKCEVVRDFETSTGNKVVLVQESLVPKKPSTHASIISAVDSNSTDNVDSVVAADPLEVAELIKCHKHKFTEHHSQIYETEPVETVDDSGETHQDSNINVSELVNSSYTRMLNMRKQQISKILENSEV